MDGTDAAFSSHTSGLVRRAYQDVQRFLEL